MCGVHGVLELLCVGDVAVNVVVNNIVIVVVVVIVVKTHILIL